MGQPGPPAQDPDLEAATEECKRSKLAKLNLRKSQRNQIPADVKGLSHLRTLDISENPIHSLVDANGAIPLPEQLTELVLTGCQVEDLPGELPRKLKVLQKLFMGANRLTSPGPVFQLPSLLHAGLSFNPIHYLPNAHELSACTNLISLDLSGCDLEDLDATLSAVAALPHLQSLSLAGNPFCLLPRYQPTIKGAVSSKLVYLDGQRMEALPGMAGSRPGTAVPLPALLTRAAAAAAQAEVAGGLQAAAAVLSGLTLADLLGVEAQAGDEDAPAAVAMDTYMELNIEGLQVLEDPFLKARETWAGEQAAAQAAGTPPIFTLTPPLQPCFYHFEMEGCDGSSLIQTVTLTNRLATQATQRFPPLLAPRPASPPVVLPADPAAGGAQDATGVLPATPTASSAPPAAAAPPTAVPPATPPATASASGVPAAAAAAAAAAGELPPSPRTAHGDAGAAGGPAAPPVPEVPPLASGDATQYASIPLKLMPPQPPNPDADLAAAAGGKGKDRKAAPAKPGSAKKGAAAAGAKKGAAALEPVAEAPLERGCLKVAVGLHADVGARDWLRSGIRLRLYRTQLVAVPKPLPPVLTPEPSAVPAKGKGASKPPPKPKGKEEPPPGPDMSQFDIVPTTTLIGGGVVPGAALASGSIFKVSELVPLLPERALWDEKGVRMALKDARHSAAPVAQCNATLTLHVLPPDMTGKAAGAQATT